MRPSGATDAATGHYTAESHPRVFLLVQERADGTLCQFAESYATQTLSEAQIGSSGQCLRTPAKISA